MQGDAKFILKNTLKNNANGILVEDKLIIKVDLTIYGEVEHITERYSDEITYRIGDTTIQANHSIVADLSSYLFNEGTSDVIIIDGSYSGKEENNYTMINTKEAIKEGSKEIHLANESTNDIENHSVAQSSSKEVESIPAHKFILSLRSPVFKAMLSSDMAETITNESTINYTIT